MEFFPGVIATYLQYLYINLSLHLELLGYFSQEEFSKLMQDIACLQCVCVFISIGLKWFLKVCCHMTISRLKSLSIKCLVTGDLLLQQIRSD